MAEGKEWTRHSYFTLGEGEVCTLENMGPLWIHINLTQRLEESVEKAQYRGATKRHRSYDTDPHEYRITDTRTDTPVIGWCSPYVLVEYLVYELGITSASERIGMYVKHGKVVRRHYRIEVRNKNSE
jgi:hypothetical protein